jgi:hypothetical protein
MTGTLGGLLPTPRMLLVSPARRDLQWHIPHTLLSLVRQAATSSIPTTLRPSSSHKLFPNLPIPPTTTTITIYIYYRFPISLPATHLSKCAHVCPYYYVLLFLEHRDTCVRASRVRTSNYLHFVILFVSYLTVLLVLLHYHCIPHLYCVSVCRLRLA